MAIGLALTGLADAQQVANPPPKTDESDAAVKAKDAAQLETVIVTGTRASLIKSLDLKRNAAIVQDSISATELGRFPDDNVADSLTHITGVTVSRTRGGEGQYISVRGLGSGYNIVTLNNRILATDGDGRDFAFDVLPSEVISGADVMKSAQASQIEGSIGGSVNLRSARPFENRGFHSSARIEGDSNDLSNKKGVKLSGVVSNTFANNTMGLMLGAVISNRNVRTDSMNYHSFNPDSPGSFDANGDGIISSDEDHLLGSCCIAFGSVFEKKKRAALSGVFEWKPNDKLKMTVDALVTRLDAPQIGYNQAYYVEHAEDRWSDVTIKDHLVTNMTVHNLVPEVATIINHRVVDTGQLGWNAEWKASKDLTLTGDVYHSSAKRNAGGKDTFVVAGIGGQHTGYFTANNMALPSIRVTLEDGRDLATALAARQLGDNNYGPHWAEWNGVDIKDTVTGGTLSGKLTLNKGNLDSVSFGLSSTDRNKTRNTINNVLSGGACQYCDMYSTSFASLGSQVVRPLTLPNFMRNAGGSFPNSFVYFDTPAYFAALKALDGKPIMVDGQPTGEFYNSNLTLPVFTPTQSYAVTEKVISTYAEAQLSADNWSGNLGLRWVRTRTTSNSAINRIVAIDDPTPNIPTSSPNVTYSPDEPVSETGTYSKLLPSLNFSYLLTKNLVARVSAAKVMARPSLDKLAPTRTDSTLDRSYIINVDGDAKLKPAEATQQDLSLEWYYRPKSMLTGTVFSKRIKNFITTQTDEHVDIGVPGYVYTITHPVNGDRAKVNGLEVGFQHLFDNGFGINAKFTKTNTRAYSNGEYTGQLEGVAPTASSFALLYEKHGINAQVSFDHTSKFTKSTNLVAGLPEIVEPMLWVTASVAYEINKNVSVFIEGKNLTDAIYRATLGRSDAVTGFETWGRTYTIGMNIKF